MAGYDTYYHHTDPNSAVKIMESQKIRQSKVKHGDAVKGDGAYLTKLGPSNSKHEVAKNNFDGYTNQWQGKMKEGKTDVVFEMKLPKKKVQDHSRELKRDVHLHHGTIHFSKVKDLKIHLKTGDKAYRTFKPKRKKVKRN